MSLAVSGFENYRARKPRFFELSGNAIATLKLPKDLDIQNIFEWRNIKLICFQAQDFYDEFGRYAPEVVGQERSFPINNISLAKVFGSQFRMRIDDFHFKKPLLAIAKDTTNRDLEPEFLQRSHIISYDQLLNDAQTEVELQKFQHKSFDFRTSGKAIFDIPFGAAFFLKNTRLIPEAERTQSALGVQDGDPNTIRLVNKRAEYSITAPSSGVGGLSRRMLGANRFV